MKNALTPLLVAILLPVLAVSAADVRTNEWPFIVIRHTSAINAAPDVFARLMECHRRHPGACDEFWFSAGIRMTPEAAAADAKKFAAFRSLCDEAGIRLSYQQGLTLGHGVSHHGTGKSGEQAFPDDAWRVDADGSRIGLICPRSPFVLAYERDFAKAIIGAAHPDSYWLDDDLRLGARKAQGCFCDRCIAAFNAKTGGSWTRQELTAAIFGKASRHPVRAEWIAFNAESLALYAAVVRGAADELGSPCRLGYQAIWADNIYNGMDFRQILEALSGPKRMPVGIRPGASFYIESEPRGMV